MINMTDLERVKHYSRCIQDLKDKISSLEIEIFEAKKDGDFDLLPDLQREIVTLRNDLAYLEEEFPNID